MADNAKAFIQKMKTRDMRVPITEDFKLSDLDFDEKTVVQLIIEERLPLDFIYDAMVTLFKARWFFMSSKMKQSLSILLNR